MTTDPTPGSAAMLPVPPAAESVAVLALGVLVAVSVLVMAVSPSLLCGVVASGAPAEIAEGAGTGHSDSTHDAGHSGRRLPPPTAGWGRAGHTS